MEKTVIIDGREIRFKTNGATPLKYKLQFGKDFLSEILKLSVLKSIQDFENIDSSVMEKIDFEVLYNITWTFAKTADQTIPEPEQWLETFDQFPIIEVFGELQELLIANLQSKKK